VTAEVTSSTETAFAMEAITLSTLLGRALVGVVRHALSMQAPPNGSTRKMGAVTSHSTTIQLPLMHKHRGLVYAKRVRVISIGATPNRYARRDGRKREMLKRIFVSRPPSTSIEVNSRRLCCLTDTLKRPPQCPTKIIRTPLCSVSDHDSGNSIFMESYHIGPEGSGSGMVWIKARAAAGSEQYIWYAV